MSSTILNGLVLAGGKSTRMGKDKGQIPYHGIPQSNHLYHILEGICDNTFMSIREDQQSQYEGAFKVIVDQNQFRGPFNGLLSAFNLDPEVAWLVVACDLPLIDEKSLQLLVKERDSTKLATAFATEKSGLPEPLAAIWESLGLKKAIEYLGHSESSCPRKYLINSDIKLVYPEEDT
ncbi:MAG: NTP transferase domain-containing protein, partial [Flavobacteriaceae bacterium]